MTDTKVGKYHFFWNGPFSQWYIAPFVIDGARFNCCEQYMMWSKACMFGDIAIAAKILNTIMPRDQKALGRKVKKFDVNIWNESARDIVYQANLTKFTAYSELKEFILSTNDDIIVEASPYDPIWGIGYGVENAMDNIDKWGTNWLGKELMRVREDIKNVLIGSH